MFEIKYELLDKELERLSKVTNLEEFEYESGEVEGQFQMIINNEEEGLIDKEMPYGVEYVTAWLDLFNEMVCYLGNNGFVSFGAPDTNRIRYEFEINNQNLKISKIREKERVETGQFVNVIRFEPAEQEVLFWNETISAEEFSKGVEIITEKYLMHLEAINPKLMNTKSLLRLKQSFENAKKLNVPRG